MSGTDRLITLERLKAILEAYGGVSDRWPADERAAAFALIDSADEARSIFDEAIALDALLNGLAEPAVSAAHVSRIGAIDLPAQTNSFGRVLVALGVLFRPNSRLAWQGAVATAAVAGIAAGVGLSALFMGSTALPPRVIASSSAFVPVNFDLVAESTEELADGETATGVVALSLTGDELGNGADEQTDDSEFTVATIPLY